VNDKNIQELVKMAMDIEALERAGEGGGALDSTEPIARIEYGRVARGRTPAGNWGRLLMVGVGFGTAAAACLTVALIALKPKAPGMGQGRELAARPDTPAVVESAPTVREVKADTEKCVVMTMYREADGRCTCVQMEPTEWDGGKKLADVERAELYNVAFRSPCSTSAPQALIVAVAGKPETLPRDRQQAEILAQQVSTAAASVGPHADVSALAYAAMPGLAPGSTVIAERVAMRQALRARDLAPAGINWR
jgi:hypothetical protein